MISSFPALDQPQIVLFPKSHSKLFELCPERYCHLRLALVRQFVKLIKPNTYGNCVDKHIAVLDSHSCTGYTEIKNVEKRGFLLHSEYDAGV